MNRNEPDWSWWVVSCDRCGRLHDEVPSREVQAIMQFHNTFNIGHIVSAHKVNE